HPETSREDETICIPTKVATRLRRTLTSRTAERTLRQASNQITVTCNEELASWTTDSGDLAPPQRGSSVSACCWHSSGCCSGVPQRGLGSSRRYARPLTLAGP